MSVFLCHWLTVYIGFVAYICINILNNLLYFNDQIYVIIHLKILYLTNRLLAHSCV